MPDKMNRIQLKLLALSLPLPGDRRRRGALDLYLAAVQEHAIKTIFKKRTEEVVEWAREIVVRNVARSGVERPASAA